MATLKEISKSLGISEATVSNALSGKGRMKMETRERIIQEANRAGYAIHHTIKNMLKKVIVVAEEFDTNNDPFLVGIYRTTQAAGLVWPVYGLDIWGKGLKRTAGADEIRPLLNQLLDQLSFCPSGIVYISQYPRRIPGLFTGMNIPTVAIQLLQSDADAYINFDNQQGAYEAVRCLAQAGKERIATISGAIDSYSASERMIGYQRALLDSSIVYHPKWIWIGDWSMQSGYELTRNLLDMSEPPDAIFAQNDSMALGALQALRERGIRIPQDIAVVGFDDTPVAAYSNPMLSSVYIPRIQMGASAYVKMCELLGKKKTEDVVLPCKLIIRESC